MSKPGSRRAEIAERLERARRPSMAAMDQAAAELEQERSGQPSPGGGEGGPEIALPQEEGHAHGQLTVAYNPATGESWGFNFVEHPWEEDDSIRRMADRLGEFLEGEQRYLEFRSPHDGRLHCLTREGARRVLAVDHARTMGQVAPHSNRVRLVRVKPGMLLGRSGA